jgi:hypothetical protein
MIATAAQRVVSQHGFAQVLQDTETNQQYLYSTKYYKPGDEISPFGAAGVFDTPSYLTVQIGDNQHITLDPSFLQYINHSCSPNAFFDTATMLFVCLRNIVPGDQFTFFYPSTEWQMDRSFNCCCGSGNCIGYITGASQINRNVLAQYKLTDYILSKL